MATHAIRVEWKHDWVFDGHQQDMVFPVGSTHVPGERVEAFSPKQLMLTSLAGCTGVDLASLLPKMRVPFTSLRVDVSGTLSEEAPKIYTHIHVVYRVAAPPEFRDEIERAIELSTTKYCGVHAMLARVAEITHELILS